MTMFSYVTASDQHFQGSIQMKSDNNPRTQSKQNTYFRQNNIGLPVRLKAGIENLPGYSMGDVRVHYNSSRPTQLSGKATVSQPCVQCLTKILKEVINDPACAAFMSGDTTNPKYNFDQIRTLIKNIIGKVYCTYKNIEEIAAFLKVQIPPEERPTIPGPDRSRFSAIPAGYEQDDIMLEKILRKPKDSPVTIKTDTYYHISHVNPKPFWIIQNDLIEIIGIYEHIGNDNKHYKKISSGSGPKYINI